MAYKLGFSSVHIYYAVLSMRLVSSAFRRPQTYISIKWGKDTDQMKQKLCAKWQTIHYALLNHLVYCVSFLWLFYHVGSRSLPILANLSLDQWRWCTFVILKWITVYLRLIEDEYILWIDSCHVSSEICSSISFSHLKLFQIDFMHTLSSFASISTTSVSTSSIFALQRHKRKTWSIRW